MTIPAPKRPVLFALESSERSSPLWTKLMDHFEERVLTLSKDNENDHDPVKTARIRGEIAALRKLMRLDLPPRTNESEELPPGR
jgi:hypothetical protein